MLTPAEAEKRILATTVPLPDEHCPLGEAQGRVLRAEIVCVERRTAERRSAEIGVDDNARRIDDAPGERPRPPRQIIKQPPFYLRRQVLRGQAITRCRTEFAAQLRENLAQAVADRFTPEARGQILHSRAAQQRVD